MINSLRGRQRSKDLLKVSPSKHHIWWHESQTGLPSSEWPGHVSFLIDKAEALACNLVLKYGVRSLEKARMGVTAQV